MRWAYTSVCSSIKPIVCRTWRRWLFGSFACASVFAANAATTAPVVSTMPTAGTANAIKPARATASYGSDRTYGFIGMYLLTLFGRIVFAAIQQANPLSRNSLAHDRLGGLVGIIAAYI